MEILHCKVAGSGSQRGPCGIFEPGRVGPVGLVDAGIGPQHDGFFNTNQDNHTLNPTEYYQHHPKWGYKLAEYRLASCLSRGFEDWTWLTFSRSFWASKKQGAEAMY